MTVSNPGPAQPAQGQAEFDGTASLPARRVSEEESVSLDGSASDMVPPIYINDNKAKSIDFTKNARHNGQKLFLPPTDFMSVSPMTYSDAQTAQFQLDSMYQRDPAYGNSPTVPLIGGVNNDSPHPMLGGGLQAHESLARAPSIRTEAKKAQNRLQLELSRGKLKATSRTSALLAGFAMVAIVELDLSDVTQNSNSPPSYAELSQNGTTAQPPHNLGLVIFFGVCTTLLVSVHLLALMMSTCILPHLDSAYLSNDGSSPHLKLRWYIEASWLFSTCFGLMLFLLEIGIVFWIKFFPLGYTPAAYVTTALLVPVFIIFILFTMTFYKALMRHKVDKVKGKLDELQKMYGLESKNLQGVSVI